MDEKKPNEFDEIQMLSQPLTTDEGFLNEACMNELNAAIKNIPPDYERLSSDPEWSTPGWIFRHEIVGALAKWAIRQCPQGIPTGLENVLGYLDACLKRSVNWDECAGMAQLSLCQINRLLHDILMNQGIEAFDNWNKTQAELDGKGKTSDLQFNSRYGDPDPYYDFIDLDALLRNVCIDVRDERRADDNFNKKFEEEHSSFEGESNEG